MYTIYLFIITLQTTQLSLQGGLPANLVRQLVVDACIGQETAKLNL